MKCTECGREIRNPRYINGKPYGHNCYKMRLSIIYKQWEDERNKEYSAKCFAAMQVYESKKINSSFHTSICKQWNDCKKLTAKQLECIIKGFSVDEIKNFYCIWFDLADDENKKNISNRMDHLIGQNKLSYFIINDELTLNVLTFKYPCGVHFFRDLEDSETEVYYRENGKFIGRNKETKERIFDNRYLEEDLSDKYTEVLKIIH